MPWVMTLVSLLMRIDMCESLCLLAGGSGYNLGGSFSHGVCADDGQTRIGKHLLAQFFVSALHAYDQRHVEIYSTASRDHALGDHVATHDATENVHKNGFDILVGEHDLESFGNLLCRRATSHVEEVGR